MTCFVASELLLYLAEPSRCSGLSMKRWQQLIWLMREAKLLAAFAAALQRAGLLLALPEYVQRHLQSALIYSDRQAQQIRFECSELNKLLSEADITAIFLKGAAYILADTANSRGRICNDLDVLVTKTQLNHAEQLLQQHGWRTDRLDDYDERYYRLWSHEIPPMMHVNRGTVLDLHHNLYLPVSGRAADMAQFFRLTLTTDSATAVLAPAAMVLHSIIHLFTNEDTQSALRDLWDIHLLIQQHSNVDFWQQLIDLAQQSGFITELQLCMSALQYYLGAVLDNLTEQHCSKLAIDSWWVKYILLPALVPAHPLACGWRNRTAKQLVYLRGHWIKMPLSILVKHIAVKSFIALRDQVFGKYQFDAKRPPNNFW